MNKSFIKLRRCPYEEPYHLNLVIQASNGRSSCELEFYVNSKSLCEIADGLKALPKKDFRWEIGSEKPEDRFAYYLGLHCFAIRPGGECALHIRMNNNEEAPEGELSDFYIRAMPADLDRLRALLVQFSRLDHEMLEWTVGEGPHDG